MTSFKMTVCIKAWNNFFKILLFCIPIQLLHFDCVNGFLNSIKEIIWQIEAIYRCPLTLFTSITSCSSTSQICLQFYLYFIGHFFIFITATQNSVWYLCHLVQNVCMYISLLLHERSKTNTRNKRKTCKTKLNNLHFRWRILEKLDKNIKIYGAKTASKTPPFSKFCGH